MHLMDGHVPSKCMHLDEKFYVQLREVWSLNLATKGSTMRYLFCLLFDNEFLNFSINNS